MHLFLLLEFKSQGYKKWLILFTLWALRNALKVFLKITHTTRTPVWFKNIAFQFINKSKCFVEIYAT